MNVKKREVPQTFELVEPEEPPKEQPKTALTVAPNTAPTPAVLLQLALQQGADLDRLERLMTLQERYEANEARKAMDDALSGFRGEPIEIKKRKHVNFKLDSGGRVDYRHAELADITEAIGPALSKHGLTYRWDVKQGQGNVTVDCIVSHRKGHSILVSMHAPPDTSGKKNLIQQVASTVTYLQRYTLQSALGLSARGDDNDGRGDDKEEKVELTDEDLPIIGEGNEAAQGGIKKLTDWWKGLTQEQRTKYTAHFAEMRKVARDVDKREGA